MIRIEGLTKRYGDRTILSGVDLVVPDGDTIAIVGPSGGGKSTLLRCLNGLVPFEGGSIEIAGFRLEPNASTDMRRLRSAVGMVFQELHLFPHLTVLENVTLAPKVVRGISASEAEREALRLLSRLSLEDHARAHPSSLSGGQKQRVAIARALAQKPAVLLFDEPTSALDPSLRSEVASMMNDLANQGITIVVVTHDASLAGAIADQVFALENGALTIQRRSEAPSSPRASKDRARCSVEADEHHAHRTG
jgi:ABC-type polar amino acid transport system ATPase subunit